MTGEPQQLLIPDGFDAEAFVKPLEADAARWFVATIFRKLLTNDVDAEGYAELSSVILQRVMGDRYAKMIQRLRDGGVVERSLYCVGERCFGYRLTDSYLAQRPRLVRVTHPTIRNKIARERWRHEAEQAGRRKPIHAALDNAQRGLSILPVARDFLDSLPPKSRLCQRVHVDRLERGELPFSVSSTGRVFNALAGLQRELRRYVRLCGEPIGCVDIRNSQPALLGEALATRQNPHNGPKGASTYSRPGEPAPPRTCLPPLPLSLSPVVPSGVFCLPSDGLVQDILGLGGFVELVRSGLLYDRLAEWAEVSRPVAKRRFLVDVLAKLGDYPSEVEKAFAERFPGVREAIRQINRESHCEAVRFLQRVESWLVVETVSPFLVGRVPIVTLHDAVYARVRDMGMVEDSFNEALERIGWSLTLKQEVEG